MNYCQDGLQVYFATETQQYDNEHNPHNLYGHYQLQPYDVSDRPYFQMGYYGLWWDGISYWFIGDDIAKGQTYGVAYYEKDAFCPHDISDWNWNIIDGGYWEYAGNDLVITCKCIFIQTK